mgnify:CR=1 FL=1
MIVKADTSVAEIIVVEPSERKTLVRIKPLGEVRFKVKKEGEEYIITLRRRENV